MGLTWNDIDFENNLISINHNTTYRPDGHGNMVLMISTPKTPAGTRTVPMFEDVRNVLLLLKSTQSDTSPNNIQYFGTSQEYSNFVLTNRHGTILLPMNINKTIKRIYTAANAYEEKLAKHENRLPVRIRHFTVHNFRHTFCTRLCEVENNIKLIMSIIGHSNVQTTMNIYNEIQESKKKSAFAELEEKMKIL
ncbi:MAG: site-specific integrase [Lachnospiraceae bacterium]|nr:site-specific integrase [Lachnospiraceae bacterium]